ncbi:hypothetical protein [Streptomyces sp. HUAS ZL42]|uniref:hypothetical protein n=1 Tax=Streptomyces sp. HUAS ZL42 TaxID=3231715 RepID=UPI00345E1FDC
MSEDQEQLESERDLEEQVRELLAEDAYAIRPSPAPYPVIRRRGVAERRRRVAVAGAALVTLAVVPAGAYALGGGGRGADTASPTPSVSATRATTPTPAATPSGPARPATEGQLLDGVTFEEAASGLEKCIAYDQDRVVKDQNGKVISPLNDLGKASDYRILLAMKATGNRNAPGDGYFVVAVREQPTTTRVICTIKDAEAAGLNTSGGDDGSPDAGLVRPDINALKLYSQSVMDKGNWKVPFRWGDIGTVDPSVTKVTVSYGGQTSEAVLDHGWFVAAGILNQEATQSPHIKGYDAGGKLVYDSDTDKTYMKTLP